MQNTDAQTRAIRHRDGPAMILAGPGSGKTRVVTQRVNYLINTYRINPREILVITFTKAAAVEMQTRFSVLCKAGGTRFGTFHAVFFDILRFAYGYTSANVMSEGAKQTLLRQLLFAYGKEGMNEGETVFELSSEISLVKNEQIPLGNYYSRSCPNDVFRDIFRQYETLHREQGYLDFDDMLTCTWELLTQREDILQSWQKRWKYILVDEFQDINLLQYAILKLLAAPQNNLFVVGDDDQSIYRFRGAKPEIMMQFPKDYPEAKTILLDQNFRSSGQIIAYAGNVIRKNTHRFKKDIRSVRTAGVPVESREFQDQSHESLYLVQQIRKRIEEGIPCREIAVLVRTNRGAGPFAGRLMEFQIPFEMREVLPDIFDHWMAKDLFAYLHLAYEGLDRAQFLQVMNRPKRYISRESVRGAVISFEDLRTFYQDRKWMFPHLNKFESDLKVLTKLTPFAAINYIRAGMRYDEYVQAYAAQRHLSEEELLDILDEIQQSAKPYRTLEEWYAYIKDYREKLQENQKKAKKNGGEPVTVATLHASKGLEFSEVFLPDVNEGILPHRRAMQEADLEEERRLFYVGMTRAKDRLHIYHIRERYGKAMKPSEFLPVTETS